MLEQLAHYKILDRAGASELGEVFRARDTRVGRTVAITILPDDIARDADRRARFLRDARAAAALSHPNAATLYEIIDEPDQLCLVSEYVPGEPLRTMLGGRPLNARRAIHLAAQIGDALADAHALGIAHGDVRPETVIVTPKGNAKLLNVGVASWTSGAQNDGAREVDTQRDIASLGELLYEMLTGAPVSKGAPPSAINKAAPKELDAIVDKALRIDGEPRYASAATFAADLRGVDEALAARADAALPANTLVARRRAPRSATLWLVIALVVLVLGVSAWYERAWLVAAWRDVITPPR
jgi:eukaryotic-like serine/threonine-protein kinase